MAGINAHFVVEFNCWVVNFVLFNEFSLYFAQIRNIKYLSLSSLKNHYITLGTQRKVIIGLCFGKKGVKPNWIFNSINEPLKAALVSSFHANITEK